MDSDKRIYFTETKRQGTRRFLKSALSMTRGEESGISLREIALIASTVFDECEMGALANELARLLFTEEDNG